MTSVTPTPSTADILGDFTAAVDMWGDQELPRRRRPTCEIGSTYLEDDDWFGMLGRCLFYQIHIFPTAPVAP